MSPYDYFPRFKAQYDANNQEFSISGVVRPQSIEELAPSIALLRELIDRVRGVFYVNIKRLTQMNNTAFHVFSRVHHRRLPHPTRPQIRDHHIERRRLDDAENSVA